MGDALGNFVLLILLAVVLVNVYRDGLDEGLSRMGRYLFFLGLGGAGAMVILGGSAAAYTLPVILLIAGAVMQARDYAYLFDSKPTVLPPATPVRDTRWDDVRRLGQEHDPYAAMHEDLRQQPYQQPPWQADPFAAPPTRNQPPPQRPRPRGEIPPPPRQIGG